MRAAQNHPSVVAYSMSHNATGYDEDMNPDLIDGIKRPTHGDSWSNNNAKLALAGGSHREEASIPSRIVYHHSSGNLGSMHTMNFYLNFVPIQEMSDWFEHWSTKGVKPVFTVRVRRAVLLGLDDVSRLVQGPARIGQRPGAVGVLPRRVERPVPRRPGVPDRRTGEEGPPLGGRSNSGPASSGIAGIIRMPVGSTVFDDPQTVFAQYTTDNWRAFRTWGVSANSPWEYARTFWKLRKGLDRRRKELKVDWDNLQKPGFSPDYTAPRQGSMSMDVERGGLDSDGGRAGAASATTGRCWPTSAASRAASRARTTTSAPAKRSRSNSSSSTIRGKP